MPAFSTTVRAQPGYGLDPFWPYNNQYTPYVTPIGPADPAAGGRAVPMMPNTGIRGANRFEEYMNELQGGPGRGTSDRSSIGVPYYRSAVSPNYDPRGRGNREYQPNAGVDAAHARSQREVADKYSAYFAAGDPARRAELLREYRRARREAALALSRRGPSPSRALDSSSRLEPGARRGDGSGAGERPRAEAGRLGPAPDVPAIGTRRSSSPPARRTTPSDVLNRSRTMDLDTGLLPGSTSIPRSRVRGPGRPRPSPSRPAADTNP
jgi:hypothetical protein